jgi:hypothetical protein
MTTNKSIAEKNLKEFLEKQGREGFLKLLLKNYLYELAMYYLHSGTRKPAVSEDTGYQFYVDGAGRAYNPTQIEKFKRDLESECLRKASQIVEEVKRLGIIENIDKDFLANPNVAKLVHEAFDNIMKPEKV